VVEGEAHLTGKAWKREGRKFVLMKRGTLLQEIRSEGIRGEESKGEFISKGFPHFV